MTRLLCGLLLCLSAAGVSAATRQYAVHGMVVSVNPAARTFTASINEIPGFMRAMVMPFAVNDPKALDGLSPGAIVDFTLIVDDHTSYAEQIRIVRYQSVEQDPMTANRLALLSELNAGTAAVKPLAIGEAVPDFTLTDQRKRPLTFSSLRGKVVALNFIYTNCALPNFCLRLANNFNVVQRRFSKQLGQDLILLTVTFDPIHDTPEVLAAYAAQWQADANLWHFLTGREVDVARVSALFGVQAFRNEGLMDHSLHTVIVSRQGTVVANLEGNQFTATQLGDLIATVLTRR